MKADELKNWLAVLGIGGGLAIGGAEAVPAADPVKSPQEPREPSRENLQREPLYVVINHEEQYSIWPAAEEPPEEWKRISDPVDLTTAVGRFRGAGELRFRVVINHEEQYSIWPLDRDLPRGFRALPSLRGAKSCAVETCAELLERLPRRRN